MYPDPDLDWWVVGPGRDTCKDCGEDKSRGLVHEVVDARGVMLYCGVCSNHWWIERHDLVRDVSGVHVREDD